MIGRALRAVGAVRLRPDPRPSLRPALPRDADAIAAILSEVTDRTPWLPRVHTRAEDRAHARDLVARMRVTVAGRPVQGFLARQGAFIHALYLVEGVRRRGIGSRLLAQAQAETDRLDLWVFQANTPARAFYARHGFIEIEETDGRGNDEGLPDVRLHWVRDGVEGRKAAGA